MWCIPLTQDEDSTPAPLKAALRALRIAFIRRCTVYRAIHEPLLKLKLFAHMFMHASKTLAGPMTDAGNVPGTLQAMAARQGFVLPGAACKSWANAGSGAS